MIRQSRIPRRSNTEFSSISVDIQGDLPSTTPKDVSKVASKDLKVAEHETESWTTLAEKLELHDDETIAGCNTDIDTLLVFAGLFSSVLTAFVIEIYRNLQPDPDTISSQILLQISNQLSSFALSSQFANSTQPTITSPSFQPSSSAVRTNALWFTSLILSLIVASLSILVKQWLRQYSIRTCTSPEERIRVRHLRYEGLIQWGVFEIVAILPLMLQLALVLFFIGLSDFLRSLYPVLGWFVTTLIVIWLLLFSTSTFAPVFFSQCPYTTPFLKPLTRIFRSNMWRLRKKMRLASKLPKYCAFPGDEMGIRRDTSLDIAALIQADRVFRDDSVVNDVLRQCLGRFGGEDVLLFTRHMLSHRLNVKVATLDPKKPSDHPIEFSQLHTRTVSNSVTLLLTAVEKHSTEKGSDGVFSRTWMEEALCHIFSTLDHCAQNQRIIGILPDKILNLHIKMLSHDDHSARLWITLRLRFPAVPFQLAEGAIQLEAVVTISSIALELAERNDTEPIHLLRVVLDTAVTAIPHHHRDLASLQAALTTFHSFATKLAAMHHSGATHSEDIANSVTRSLEVLKKRFSSIPSYLLPKGLQQILDDIHVKFSRTTTKPDTRRTASPDLRTKAAVVGHDSVTEAVEGAVSSSSAEQSPVAFDLGAKQAFDSPSQSTDIASFHTPSTENDTPIRSELWLIPNFEASSDVSSGDFDLEIQPPSDPPSPSVGYSPSYTANFLTPEYHPLQLPAPRMSAIPIAEPQSLPPGFIPWGPPSLDATSDFSPEIEPAPLPLIFPMTFSRESPSESRQYIPRFSSLALNLPRTSLGILPAPTAFGRPAAGNMLSESIKPTKIIHDMEDLRTDIPPLPLVCVLLDILQDEWLEYTTDLRRAWLRTLPDILYDGEHSDEVSLAMQLTEEWNTQFFSKRGGRLLLRKGSGDSPPREIQTTITDVSSRSPTLHTLVESFRHTSQASSHRRITSLETITEGDEDSPYDIVLERSYGDRIKETPSRFSLWIMPIVTERYGEEIHPVGDSESAQVDPDGWIPATDRRIPHIGWTPSNQRGGWIPAAKTEGGIPLPPPHEVIPAVDTEGRTFHLDEHVELDALDGLAGLDDIRHTEDID